MTIQQDIDYQLSGRQSQHPVHIVIRTTTSLIFFQVCAIKQWYMKVRQRLIAHKIHAEKSVFLNIDIASTSLD